MLLSALAMWGTDIGYGATGHASTAPDLRYYQLCEYIQCYARWVMTYGVVLPAMRVRVAGGARPRAPLHDQQPT
eukprot:3072575-Rhodomonas_salina.2